MAILFSACSPLNSPEPTEPARLVEQSPTPQRLPEPALTSIPTLPPFDGAALRFEEGRYQRDAYCSRIFDYHKAVYGSLTIAIADNLPELPDRQELAAQVAERYIELYNNSPVPLSRPLTVYTIPDPNLGECHSTGQLVFVSPDDVDSKSFTEELLGAATGISEYWVLAGLSSLALDEQPDRERLRTRYQNTGDLDMAGLFYARFSEGWAPEEERDIARLSATALVQYALEVENIQPDKLVQQVNNDVRTRWLESLGVNRAVTYPYDGRFEGFTYSQSSDCSLIVQADNMRFCLNRLPDQEYFDEIAEAEFLIDHAYYGRQALVEYILAEAPSVAHLTDPEESIVINVTELNRLGFTYGNTITLNRSSVYYDVFHEIVHTFEWNQAFSAGEVWLTEGFAEYLGNLLPVYRQTTKRSIFEDLSGRLNDINTSSAPGTSYWYFLDSEQFEAAQAWYQRQGGQIQYEESVDPRLYTDAVAFATMYRDAYGGSRGVSIGEKYGRAGQDGLELSYTQAALFVAWLCDTYSIDRVLDVYVNQAEEGKLDGKSYAELKSGWLASLISKGQGIDIPGSP